MNTIGGEVEMANAEAGEEDEDRIFKWSFCAVSKPIRLAPAVAGASLGNGSKLEG
jgi:hypothetical protein